MERRHQSLAFASLWLLVPAARALRTGRAYAALLGLSAVLSAIRWSACPQCHRLDRLVAAATWIALARRAAMRRSPIEVASLAIEILLWGWGRVKDTGPWRRLLIRYVACWTALMSFSPTHPGVINFVGLSALYWLECLLLEEGPAGASAAASGAGSRRRRLIGA